MAKTWHPIRRAKKINAWRKRRAAAAKKRRAAREKKRAAAAKKAGTTTTDQPGWLRDLMSWIGAKVIDLHMDMESATGYQNPGNPFRDRPLTETHKKTAVEHAEHRSAEIDRRKHRRGQYLCHAHTPPMRFATPQELAIHVEEHEDKRVQNVMPAPTPKSPKAKTDRPAPKVKVKKHYKSDTELKQVSEEHIDALRKHVPHIDQIREGAVKNVGAQTGVELLGEIGTTPIQSVSQVRELSVALEQVGLAIEEGVNGFMQNARQSPSAPIDEEVLKELQPMVDAGAAIAAAALKFLAAFEEFYGPEIRKAQNEERMSNAALTH